MATCDACGVFGWTVPLYTRLIAVGLQTECLTLCAICKSQADAELVRKIEMWEPPFGPFNEEDDEMRGTRAKALRARVYGTDASRRFREWTSDEAPEAWGIRFVDRLGKEIGRTVRRLWRGRVTADPLRRAYQQLKRLRRGMSHQVARELK